MRSRRKPYQRALEFGIADGSAEGGGGKIKLLNAGAYKDNDVDISLITHPGISPNAALVRTAAYSGFIVEYFGKEAHAAARPWDGVWLSRPTSGHLCKFWAAG